MTEGEIRDDECVKIAAHIKAIADSYDNLGHQDMGHGFRMLSIAVGEVHVHRTKDKSREQIVTEIAHIVKRAIEEKRK